MEDMELEHFNGLKTMVKPLPQSILMLLSTKPVLKTLDLSVSTESLKSQAVIKSRKSLLDAPWLLELMPPTGICTKVESSTTAIKTSTMLSFWSVHLPPHGLSRTAGPQLGESKATSDLPREIPVLFAKDLPSPFDLNLYDLSIITTRNIVST